MARFPRPPANGPGCRPLNVPMSAVSGRIQITLLMPIVWPEEFHPTRAPVHVRNEITIDTADDRVWAWLVRAQLWPSWYANCADVRFVNTEGPDLRLGTEFTWRTFGVPLRSVVAEFVPFSRIAWHAVGVGVRACHAWLIEPSSRSCHVTTEETQYGVLARTGDLLMPRRMSRGHQRWLEALRDQATQGLPNERFAGP